MNNPRPTLKDIAARGGVSPMAVSLALRNSARISVDTRTRLQELAREMGYRPNAFAANLVQQRISRHAKFQAALAYIHCSERRDDWVKSGTHRRFREGAMLRADELGYQLEDIWLEDPLLTPEKLQGMLHHRGIPGLLLSTLSHRLLAQPGYMAKFTALDISTLACGTVGWRIEAPNIHCASNDQYHTATLAMQNLVALGYERIGLVVTASIDEALSYRFRAGYLALRDVAPDTPRIPVQSGEAGRRSFLEWCAEWRPDAVISQMPHVIPWLRSAKLRVPEDVAVALLDLQYGKHDAGCAGINQNHTQVGMAAVDLVVSQIQRNESGCPPYQKSLLIEGEWVPGWSAPGK